MLVKFSTSIAMALFGNNVFSVFSFVLKQSSGDSGANVKRLELETDAKIQNLKVEAARISHDVVHMLLKHVNTVRT